MKQIIKTDKTYFIGLLFLVIGLLICLSAYLIFFGCIFYVIGSVIVLFSRKSILLKALTIVLPFGLYLITFNIIYVCRPRTIPTTYIIPKDFNGVVKIAYGLDCGIEPEVVNNKRILRIPQSGILLLRSNYDSGITNSEDERYYFDGDSEVQIPKIYWLQQYDSLKQSILSGSYGELDSAYFKYRSNIPYVNFHIFNNDTVVWTHELINKYSHQKDSIFEIEVRKCINKK